MYKVLESGGRLTQKDLIRETSLPSRTVRYALGRLKAEKILIERYNFTDARQSLYEINRVPSFDGVPGSSGHPILHYPASTPGTP